MLASALLPQRWTCRPVLSCNVTAALLYHHTHCTTLPTPDTSTSVAADAHTTFVHAPTSHPFLFHSKQPIEQQPRGTTDIRDFLKKARRKDATSVKIKKTDDYVKFKLRLSKYLYTLKVTDMNKADRISKSFPPELKTEEIKN
jgi:large subunit ribosomal protein L38e